MEGYWFKSTLFDVEAGEEEEVNPGRTGRQLARWLKERLESAGYADVDVIPEDWGWCVMCQRDPFMLWVGCGNVDEPGAAMPPKEESVWHCFAHAETGIFKRLFGKVDTALALKLLNGQLNEILTNGPGITMVDEP